MTNAQKWVAGFLLLFVLLLALSKMTQKEDGENAPINAMSSEANPSTGAVDVENILASNRCYVCHGRDLNGSGMAPSLAKVGENWKKPSLVSYFQNPTAFLNNQRMAALKDQYNRSMPAFENLSQEELNALADYLLNR